MTGIENLDEIHMLEMRVDTSETSLGNFGAHVPNLSKLKLSNSIVSSVRYSSFYPRDTMLAWVYAMAFSSVCVSHTCFVSKWLNVSLKFFYHLIAHHSSFSSLRVTA